LVGRAGLDAGRACCLLVMLLFAARAGIGLVLPDALSGADAACECEAESPTEEIESDHDTVDALPGSLCRGRILELAPAAIPLPASPRATAIDRSQRLPPLLRGPPA